MQNLPDELHVDLFDAGGASTTLATVVIASIDTFAGYRYRNRRNLKVLLRSVVEHPNVAGSSLGLFLFGRRLHM
jgi:hypothetical protein